MRVKELKKRNGELVNLAKKLEEKAKRLQEELRDLVSYLLCKFLCEYIFLK